MNLLITTQKTDRNDQNLGFFHGWIREFAAHFDQVTVICLEEGEHDLPANVRVLSLGKEARSTEQGAGSRLRYAARFYRHIWRERKNYDAVFVHMNPEYVVLGGCLWKMWGKKVALWYTHKSVDLKLRIAERFADRIFTASKESFQLKSGKVLVTGHGIDTDYFVPAMTASGVDVSRPLRLVTVGRISPSKEYGTMIAAVKAIKDSGVSMHLGIVGGPIQKGDSGYLERLKRLVAEARLTQEVVFIGPVAPEKTLSYLQNADIFINASRTGSLDKAILEAMACGLVVVSSNNAVRAILEPLGLFFPHGDAERLTGILRRVASDGKEKNAGIGEKLRSIAVREDSLASLISRLSAELSSAPG